MKRTAKSGWVILLGFVLVLFSFGTLPEIQAAEYRIKFSSVAPPEDPAQTAIEFFSKKIAEKTGNQVKVSIFPSGQLGQHREVIQGLQSGAIEMAFFSSTWLGTLIPEFGVLDLPYLVTRKEDIGKLLEGEVGKTLLAKMPPNQLRGLTFSECNFRGTFTKKPVKSAADLKGLKLRVPSTPTYIATMKAMGALATPIAFGEVYTAIQQGVVDGAENTPSAYYSYKFFEVAPHWTFTNHAILPGLFIISEPYWQKLPKDIQKAVEETGVEAGMYHRKVEWQVADDYLEKAKAKGATITQMDLSSLVKATRGVYGEFEGKIGKDLMDKVKRLFPAQ
jgi:tripartite ATP-independent transporter DctP family solute receptor